MSDMQTNKQMASLKFNARYSQQAFEALRSLDKGNNSMLPKEYATDAMTCKRILALNRGQFVVKRVPCLQFPDPDVTIQYQLTTVGHFDDSIDLCGCETFQGGRQQKSCICSCYRQRDVMNDDEDGEVHEGVFDLLRTGLLLAVRKVPELSFAHVCGTGGTYVEFDGVKARGKIAHMPSASDILEGKELRYVSYGTGCAYLKIVFPYDTDMNFTFAVTGINYDS